MVVFNETIESRSTKKLGIHCISRIHFDEFIDGRHIVHFISLHTGRDIGPNEFPHLYLPNSIKLQSSLVKMFHQREL